MSSRTAWRASRLLWISLMMAFTPGSPGSGDDARPGERARGPRRQPAAPPDSAPSWQFTPHLQNMSRVRGAKTGKSGTTKDTKNTKEAKGESKRFGSDRAHPSSFLVFRFVFFVSFVVLFRLRRRQHAAGVAGRAVLGLVAGEV